MSIFVRFWGTRGSIPTPGTGSARYGGNTACIEIRTSKALIICDGGTGLRELGMHLMSRASAPSHLHAFFSHAHWDHIQGFPFFAPAYVPTNRITVYGQSVKGRTMHALLSGQMQHEYFPVSFSELSSTLEHGELGREVIVGDVRVTWMPQDHPGGSLAYCFESQGSKVIYATDSELDRQIENLDEAEADLSRFRRLPSSLVDFMAGADLIIGDGQYFDGEYATKRGWGHPRAGTVVDLAVAARAKQLAITHHDPMQTDRDVDRKVAEAQARASAHGSSIQVFGAREGFELKIG